MKGSMFGRYIVKTVTVIVEDLARLRGMAPDGSDQVRAYHV
jgi:hypothetical protein